MRYLIIALLALLPFAVLAQEEEPAPILSLSKTATADPQFGAFAGFNIVATNSGDLGSDIEIRDQLPQGYDWLVTGIGGDITCDLSETQFLQCFGSLGARELEEQESGEVIFVNGVASVSLRAYMHQQCVELGNLAVLIGGGNLLSASATLSVECPATPTPTNTPTPTSTPQPTQTPVVVTATPTATTFVAVPTPKAPSTGTGTTTEGGGAPLLGMAVLGALAFGMGGLVVARRAR